MRRSGESPQLDLLCVCNCPRITVFPRNRNLHILVRVHEQVKRAPVFQQRKKRHATRNLPHHCSNRRTHFLVAALPSSTVVRLHIKHPPLHCLVRIRLHDNHDKLLQRSLCRPLFHLRQHV